MSFFDSRIVGALVIATVVGAGYWYAEAIESRDVQAAREAQNTNGYIASIDWSVDGSRLLTLSRCGADARGSVRMHDLSETCDSQRLNVDTPPLYTILFAELAPDGRHVLASQTGPRHSQLTWFDVTTSETSLLGEFVGTKQPMLTRTAISPDCRCVAAADESNKIHIFHPEWTLSNDVVVKFELREGVTSHALHFSGDGKQLLSANSDGSISIWDVESGRILNELLGHRGRVAAALFFGDGAGVISAGDDGSVRLWQLPSGREIRREKSRSRFDTALAVTGDGQFAAWGGRDHGIVIWDLLHQRPKHEIQSPVAVTDLKFSPHGHSLAVAGFSSVIRIYNVETGEEERVVDIDRE